jgi:acetyl esterase/lipase
VETQVYNHLATSDIIRDVVNHPAFKGFGSHILPRDDNTYYYDTRLNNVGSLMSYHNHVDPAIVIGAINHLIDQVSDGKTAFYDFYTDEQKQQDPTKRTTGLFFFRGNPDAPFAIVCPGGGFSYVGSLHEGFPLAQRISESGFHAFIIRYRTGSEHGATEDLAAAIAYIFRSADTLGVGTRDYSVWGGSAGARMVGNIALHGVSAYGNDSIANVNIVDKRVENLKNAGVDVGYRRYENAGHGFGLGTGTDAEGWVDLAVQFWQRHITGTV